MKVNKAGFWITFVLFVASLAVGIVFLLLPQNCPVSVEGTVDAYGTKYGEILFEGKLVNNTDEDVYIQKLEIVVPTDGATIYATDSKGMTIKAGSYLDLSDYGVDSYNTPKKISKIAVTINGKEYTIYGFRVPLVSVLLIFLAIIFLVIAISLFTTNRKKKKAYQAIAAKLPQNSEVYSFNGVYSQEGNAARAVKKTLFSALGGAISALFLGAGFYKVYSAGTMVELIVCDDGLYVLDSSNPNATKFFAKGNFPESTVTTEKNHVTLTNVLTKEYFMFRTTKKGLTPNQLVEKLETLIKVEPTPVAASAEAPSPSSSPFEDFDSAAEKTDENKPE